MKLSGNWLAHPGTQALLAALAGAGHRALVVGGAVRDALLGLPVGDVDIATDARPEYVTIAAETAGFRVVPTGIGHGTVTVIAGGKAHEVTTFRRDVATDGRHATVEFETDLTEDARRRDFTLNALYATAAGEVIDPLGGLADVLARRIRFVGTPEARIREDYLRILRLFRFMAQIGDPDDGPDPDALAACAALADGLAELSRERVGAEMRKLLGAPDPSKSVSVMAVSGILARVLPGADPAGLGPLVLHEGARPPDWLRRLAVLGGEDPGDALRLSRAETADLAAIRVAALGSLGPAALGFRLRARAADALLVRAALSGQPPPETWQAEVMRGQAVAHPPVTAADLMPGLTGAALGTRLKALEDRWLDSGLRLTRTELLRDGR
jgi:poly(A) polymerase